MHMYVGTIYKSTTHSQTIPKTQNIEKYMTINGFYSRKGGHAYIQTYTCTHIPA